MEFQLLVENGELTIADSELFYLVESLGLTEDEVMSIIAEGVDDSDITSQDIENGYVDFLLEEDGEKFSITKKVKEAWEKAKAKGISAKDFIVKYAKEHPGKTAAIAAGAIGVTAGTAYALKKRKAKKANERAMRNEDVMIGLFFNEDGDIFMANEDMDFLLEAFDYELSEAEIMEAILEADEGEFDLDAHMKALGKNAVDQYKKVEKDKKRQQNRLKNDEFKTKAMGKMYDIKEKAKEKWNDVATYAKEHPGKTAAIAAGVVGAGTAIGVGAHHALKKRKARKAEEAKKSEDVMIELFFEGGDVYISNEDMDFLLEAYDYELSVDDISYNILYETEVAQFDPTKFMNDKEHREHNWSQGLSNNGGPSKEQREEFEKKMKKLTSNRKPDGSKKGVFDKVKEAGGKVVDYAKQHPGKTAAIAAGALGVGAGAAYALKKRKAKKAEQAKKSEDVMIELFFNEDGDVYISNDDMDFLLEAFDYEVTEEDISYSILFETEAAQFDPTKFMNDKEHREYNWSQGLSNNGGPSKEQREEFEKKMKKLTANKKPDGSKKGIFDKVKEAGGKAVDWAKKHPGKATAIGAGAVLGTAAVGYAANKALKKRNAKKNKSDRSIRESVIDILVTENAIYVDQIDMDFLLEACEFELSENEIMDNILAEAQDTMGHIPGRKVVITSSRELAKIEEKQLDDIPERVKDGKLGNEEVAASTANVGKKEIQESVEYDEYAETFEGDHLIMEAILEDAGIELSEAQMQALIEANLLSERSIVRLDKAAKRSQAEKKALVVIAREQGDPLYKKLVKVYKMKNEILDKLDSKYGTRAIARVRGNAKKIDKE